jgi:LacI family transcriptional regulator
MSVHVQSAMATGNLASSLQVALILDSRMHYDRKVVRGIAAYAERYGNWNLHVEEAAGNAMRFVRSWDGDGIIAFIHDSTVVAALEETTIPAVGIQNGYAWPKERSSLPWLASDDEAIACAALEHLLQQGLPRVAYCGMPGKKKAVGCFERGQAFKRLAAEKGVPCSAYSGLPKSNSTWAETQDGLCEWLAAIPRPVGIMAYNDARGRQVLEACKSIGAIVPEEVAVVGVDNDEVLCELSNPHLSSVEHSGRELGYQAAALLEQRMSGKAGSSVERLLVPPKEVVVRQSTSSQAIADDDVAAALHFIRERACGAIQVSDIVAATRSSRATLKRRFKAVTGRTLLAEIQRVRLERAKELLGAGHLSLRQVALKSGFCSVQYLSTVFRQGCGQTPREYRDSLET